MNNFNSWQSIIIKAKNGHSIDREPLSKFIGESIVIDLSKRRNIREGITCSDLETYSEAIRDNGIVLLYTGTSENWMTSNSRNDIGII
jgi:kynurenine formamidase